MIDVKELKNNFDQVADKLIARGVDESMLEGLKRKREEFVKAQMEVDELKSIQNKKSKLFPEYKKEGREGELRVELENLKKDIADKLALSNALEEEFSFITENIPNIPDDIVPYGESEEDNVELKRVLEIPSFDFTPKEHWELAESNGWIDFEAGAKLAGSRFSVFRREGARVQRALINYMLDFNSKRGFEEVMTPVIVNANTLFGTGQLPKFEDDLYKLEGEEGYYLIPTAEVTLTNLYNDTIISPELLPINIPPILLASEKRREAAGEM